jgi:O-antigen/teichoic acid export membrane protein
VIVGQITVRIQRFTSDVLWNLGSLLFLAVGGLFMNGLIVGLRGAEALGIFNQVFAFYIVLSQIGVGGVQFSVLQQISYAQDEPEVCADTTIAALLLVVGLTIPLCLLGLALAAPLGRLLNSPEVAVGLAYVMPGLIFFAANKVLINVLNGLRYMRAYAVFRALRFILIPLFIVAIIAAGLPDSALALALTLSELVLMLALLPYIYGWVLPLRWPAQVGKYLRSHRSYGLRGMLSGVLIELNTRVDVIMLGIFLNDRMVGWYSFAAILAEGFAQIPMAVRYNVDPLLGEAFAKSQREQITQLAQRIRRVLLPVMAGLGGLAALVYPLIFMFLAGSEGLAVSWGVFAILVAAQVLVAGYSPMRGVLLQGGVPGAYTLIILATALANAAINLLLIPVLGLVGAALATGAMILLEMVCIVILARQVLRVRI